MIKSNNSIEVLMQSRTIQEEFKIRNEDNGAKIIKSGKSRTKEEIARTLGYILNSGIHVSPINDQLINPANMGKVQNYGLNFNYNAIGKDEKFFKLDGYSREELKDYYDRMDSVLKGESSLYTFDIETIGTNRLLHPDALEINKSTSAITELVMWRTFFENGEVKRERVKSLYSFPKSSNLNYSKLLETTSDANLKVTLERIAGYSLPGSVVLDSATGQYKVKKWTPNVDITNEKNIINGIKNLSRLNSSDSEAFKNDFEDFINIIKNIENENKNGKKNIISSVNGLMFDIPNILAIGKQLGIDVDGLFNEGHYDTQLISKQIGKEKIYKEHQALRLNGIDIDDTLTLEDRKKVLLQEDENLSKDIKALFNVDVEKGQNPSHLADFDAFITSYETLKSYGMFKEDIEKISNNQSTIDLNNMHFVANSSFGANNTSAHFKIDEGKVNTYNSFVIDKDNLYKMNVFKISSIDDLGELKEQGISKKYIDDLKDKYVAELTDEYDNRNKSYLIYNTMEDMQKDLIDSDLLSPIKLSKKTKDILRLSKKHTQKDNIRKMIEGFGSSTSTENKRIDYLKNMIEQFEELDQIEFYDFDDGKGGIGDSAVRRKLTTKEKVALLKGEKVTISGLVHTQEELLTKLRSKKANKDGTKNIIIEKRKAFSGLYNDIGYNKDLYNKIINQIDDTISLNEENYVGYSADKSNFSYTSNTDRNKIVDSSLAFGSTIDDLERAALDNMSDIDKLEYIINSDEYLKKQYSSILKRKPDLNEENKIKALKNLFKSQYREEYSNENKVAMNIIKGKKILHNRRIITSVDILGSNGEYTSVMFRNKGNFEDSLLSKINFSTKGISDIATKKAYKMKYTEDIASDLLYRKLITKKDYDYIINANTVNARASAISSKLYKNKRKVNSIILKSIKDIEGIDTVEEALLSGEYGLKNLYNKRVISEKEFKMVKPFIDNQIMDDKWYYDVRRIAGKPLEQVIKEMEEKGLINLDDIISKNIQKAIPKNTLSGKLFYASDEDLNERFSKIYGELGWEDKHKELFNSILKSKEFNESINSKYDDTTTSFSKLIYKEDDDYFLIMTKNENTVRNRLAKGETIRDLANQVATFKLPRIEYSLNGGKYISQTSTSKKAVTNSIVARYSSEGLIYNKVDTVEEVLIGFKNNIKFIRERIYDNNYEEAGKKARASWSSINESKSLTGATYKYINKDGVLAIDKVYIPNRADLSKSGVLKYSSIAYELRNLLKNNEKIKNKFYDRFSGLGQNKEKDEIASNIIKKLENDYMRFEDGNKYFSKYSLDSEDVLKRMGNEGVLLRAFMLENMQDIFTELSQDKSFMEGRGAEIKDLVELLAKHGNASVYVKPHDADSDFINLDSILEYIPHSNITNTARETGIQGMNTHSIDEESIKTAYDFKLKDIYGEASTVDEVYNKLGIIKNYGVMTENVHDMTKELDEKYGAIFGFTTKTKHLKAGELIDKLNDIHESKTLQDIIKDQIFKNTQGKIKATNEEIKHIAKLVSSSTSLYEDSSMMNIALYQVLMPQSITNQKVHTPNKNLKIGDKVKINSVIGYDIDGNEILARDSSTVVNVKPNEVLFQLNKNMSSIKINYNHSEKSVAVVPTFNRTGDTEKDNRMIRMISEFQYYLSDGANIVINPSVIKHDAMNTVMIPSEEAITQAIKTEAESKYVNEIINEYAPNLDISIKYDELSKRYITINKPRSTSLKKVNPIKELQEVIQKVILQNQHKDLASRVKENVDNLKKADQIIERVGYSDIGIAANNTTERMLNASAEGSGVSISNRIIPVLGTYLEVDKEHSTSYKNATFYENILKEDMDNILLQNADKNREVNNIYYALNSAYTETVPEHVKVKKVNLKEIILPKGLIETEHLDQIFRYSKDVNLYEIDLSEFGISLKNQFYIGEAESAKEIVNKSKHSKTVSKIYIPATKPNISSGKASTNKLQRDIVDLLRSIQEIMYFNDGSSSASTRFKKAYKELRDYNESLAEQLVSVDGIRLSSLKTKNNIGSARLELHKITAPVRDKNGVLKDLSHGKKITILNGNGKVEYVNSSFVNPEMLEDLGVNFDIFGNDLLTRQVNDEATQLNFLKNEIKNIDISKANSLKEAQDIINNSNIKVNKRNLATRYLTDIGVEGLVSRDPIIMAESRSANIIRIDEGISYEGISTESVSATKRKGDSDGDKISLLLNSFRKDGKGNLVIMDYDSNIRKELRVGAIMQQKADTELLKYLEEDMKESENIFDLDEYYEKSSLKKMIEDVSSGGDINYVTNPTARTILANTLVSKAIIGQSSNPGLYLKVASMELTNEIAKSDKNLALKMNKSITVGALVIEQSSIDQKLNKFGPEVSKKSTKHLVNAIDIPNAWNDLFVNVLKDDKEQIKKSLTTIINIISPYTKTTDQNAYRALKWQNLKEGEELGIKKIDEIVENIMKGNIDRSIENNVVYVEEMLHDILKVFSNEKSASLYVSALNSRTVGSLRNLSKLKYKKSTANSDKASEIEFYEQILKLKNNKDYDSAYAMLQIRQLDDLFLSDKVTIGDEEVTKKSRIYIQDEFDGIKRGIYKLNKKIEPNSFKVTLTNVETKERTVINAENVFEINKKLNVSNARLIQNKEDMKEAKVDLFNRYKTDIDKDILSSQEAFDRYKDQYYDLLDADANKLNTNQRAVLDVLGEYDLDNLEDMHNTINFLESKYNLDGRESMLRKINEEIKRKGKEKYKNAKRKLIFSIEDINKYAFNNKEAFMNGIESEIAAYTLNFTKEKEILESNKRINIDQIRASEELNDVVDNFINSYDLGSKVDVDEALVSSIKKSVIEEFSNIDNNRAKEISQMIIKNQDKSGFAKNVLGWDIENFDSLRISDKEEAIRALNTAINVISDEHIGKSLGELSLEELENILKNSNENGLSSDIINTNKKIINDLIELRKNNDIMLNTSEPMLENLKDNTSKEMLDRLNENIIKQGKKAKKGISSTASKGTGEGISLLEKFSQVSSKKKIAVAAMAAAGIGATMMLGNTKINSNTSINTKNENESNMTNRKIKDIPKSQKTIYTSDSNSINVNVKARSQMNTDHGIVNKAISSLFGNNVSINSNYQDSRDDIKDYEVDRILEKSLI